MHPLFKPFCIEGFVVSPDGSKSAVRILRDTGALQSLLKRSSVPAELIGVTGDVRWIRGDGSSPIEVPLVEINFSSEVLDGPVLCGLIDHLPDGVDFLLDNDLWFNTQHKIPDDELNELVVTRSMSRHGHDVVDKFHDERNVEQNKSTSVTYTDMSHSLQQLCADGDPHLKSVGTDSGASQVDETVLNGNHLEVHDVRESDSKVSYGDIDFSAIITRENLVAMQESDSSLKALFKKAEHKPYPVGESYLYVHNGMLINQSIFV